MEKIIIDGKFVEFNGKRIEFANAAAALDEGEWLFAYRTWHPSEGSGNLLVKLDADGNEILLKSAVCNTARDLRLEKWS
jgi:hypothetical protein